MKKAWNGVLVVLALLFTFCAALSAQEEPPLSFANWSDSVGGVTFSWAPVPVIADSAPKKATYQIENKSAENVTLELTFFSCDTLRVLDDNQNITPQTARSLSIPAGESVSGETLFLAESDCFNAHYPLHAQGTVALSSGKKSIHAVRVLEVRFPRSGATDDKNFETTVIENGGISLIGRDYVAAYDYKEEPINELGTNYIGNDPVSRTSIHTYTVDRGEKRLCFSVHPPYIPKGGSLYLRFPVRLPKRPFVTISYGAAIRTHQPETESPSDGVTFRFFTTEQNGKPNLLDELHTDSKTWVDRTIDLSNDAGKEVTLTVEINPGPKNDTNCDGALLSGLVVTGYESKPDLSQKETLSKEETQTYTFPLANDFEAVIVPGTKGLLDATYTFQNTKSGKSFTYRGLSLEAGTIALDKRTACFREEPRCDWDETAKKLICRSILLYDDQPRPVELSVSAQNGLLIFDLPKTNPAQIGGMRFGPLDVGIDRVYCGHGVVIDHLSEPFQIHGEGHRLASSHVGFDFANGQSVLLGASSQPDYLFVDPKEKIATLSLSGVIQMAVAPSESGAFAAAVSYRESAPWIGVASPGVTRKAGRMVFDVWGGKYTENRETLLKAFQYGVTDSLFIKHVWQRYGYDVRLPDIWGDSEENAVLGGLGTLDELRALCDACVSRKVPFALHDNYIDFYPDADDFSYKYINRDENGKPRKAWINYGMQVQSYQWRPDLFRPFLERNMKRANHFLPQMDAYFVDVFTSIGQFNFYGEGGEFHPKSETTRYWKEAFLTIGEYLAHKNENGVKESGITISEAGSDALVGGIDGADAQWLGISKNPRAWSIQLACDKWARTPWLAAVHHTDFIRHGVGYEDRYRAMRNRSLHGILSDDYLSAEILGGVDLMVDAGSVFPGSVRKHFLAQHVVRRRADQEIESVVFDLDEKGKPNVERQKVVWSDGVTVWGNRGRSDWTIKEGVTLPCYGCYVEDADGQMLTAILRDPKNPTIITERAQNGDSFYLNGRGIAVQEILAVTPTLASSKVIGDDQFKIAIDWRCDEPAPKDLSTFVHVFEPYRGYGHKQKGWFAGGERPRLPTSQWGHKSAESDSTVVRTDENGLYRLPEDIPNGVYHIMVGLFDPETGKRYPLMADEAGETRYAIAELRVRRDNKMKIEIRPLEQEEPRVLYFRIKGNSMPTTFRGVSTLGAVSVTPGDTSWKILPIPVAESFSVTLDETVLGKKVSRVVADGSQVPFQCENGQTSFTVTAQNAVVYEVFF